MPWLLSLMLVLAIVHFSSSYYRDQLAGVFGNNGQKLLAASAVNNLEQIIELVNSGKVDINHRDNFNWAPIHFAAHEGHEQLVEYLIAHGADINARTNYLWTPLLWAAYQQRYNTTAAMLRHKADVNAGNFTGNTALHLCGLTGNIKIAELLLQNGADISRRNNSGSTPLDYAVHQNQPLLVKYLLYRNADPNSGKGPGFQGKDSQPPLARAAMLGFTDIVGILLQHNAAINLPDATGNTPLHEAIRFNRIEIAVILLDHKASKSIKNRNGKTPLELCRSEEMKTAIARTIMDQALNLYKYTDNRNIIFPAPFKREF